MKKLLLLVLSALVLSFSGFSQTEKGSKMVGGTMYLATSARQGSGFLQFGLNPQVGFFVADHFAVGPGLSFSAFSYGDQRGIGYGLSPFVRYYFGSSPARLFLTAGAGISGNRSSSLDYVQSYRTTHARFGPGLTYFLNEFVGLDGVLTYDISKYAGEPASRSLNLNVGVQVFLPWGR